MRNWTLEIGHLPAGRQGWKLDRRGFSLVELMFAVVFLTVIVFGVIKLQTSNLVMSNAQNNAVQASFLANQGVEIVKALGKVKLDSECGSPPCTCKLTESGVNYDLDCLGGGYEDLAPFERTIEISNADLIGAYKVTAIVEWTDNSGEHRRDVDGFPPLENGHAEANLIIYQ